MTPIILLTLICILLAIVSTVYILKFYKSDRKRRSINAEHQEKILLQRLKTTEVLLNRQRQLMQDILDIIPIPIHLKDIDDGFKYVYWNKESVNLFGDGFLKSTSAIVGEEKAKELEIIDRKIFDTEELYVGEEMIKRLDGVAYKTKVLKSVVYDGDKKLLLVVRWDISLKTELHRKSKILSLSISALKAFTWYSDLRDGVIHYGEELYDVMTNVNEIDSIDKFARKIHPAYREFFITSMQKVFTQDSGDFTIEYEIDFLDNGHYEWWESRGTIETIQVDGESYKYIYGMDINIDSHKRNQEALVDSKAKLDLLNKQNELILNNTNTGLVFLDPDYKVQWENLSSYIPEGPIANNYRKGCMCFQARGFDAPCENCIVKHSTASGKMESKEITYMDLMLELIATPIFDDTRGRIGTVLRVMDITEKKKINLELEAAKNRAEQSNRLKSAFLANMSHEIRTPLNAIVGFSELMITADNAEDKQEYSKIINRNNTLLLTLISDILDLSKIEAGMLDLRPVQFDVADVFNELFTMFEKRIDRSKVELVCEAPYANCLVTLDKNRFTQVLTNLLTNAVKFTPKGEIRMGYKYKNGRLELFVKDTGIGIAPDKIAKVFERFEKLDDFAQGTGLGMSICKAIMEAHEGGIDVQSEQGKGSTFTVWAPVTAIIKEK